MSNRNQENTTSPGKAQDLLQRRGEALPAEHDVTPDLIGLTSRLNESLPPVEPSRHFVSSLRSRLADVYAATRAEEARRARQLRATMGAGLGTLVAVMLIARLIGSILMILAFLSRLRRHTAAT